MAIYRNVQLSFWTDSKVEDEFTPEDKYFYLYLLTNPQTNICGCYEVSYSQMTRQTGYNKETIQRLLERFDKVHNVVKFCKNTKEILILHWYKYNWSKSEKTLAGIENVARHIKTDEFRAYIFSIVESIRNDTPIMGYTCPMQASVSDTDTDTDTDTVYVSNPITGTDNKKVNYKHLLNNLLLEFNVSDYLVGYVNDWIDYKKERNFRYKKVGLRNLIKTIAENEKTYGAEAVATVIERSIASSYQGIVFNQLTKIGKREGVMSDAKDDYADELERQLRS